MTALRSNLSSLSWFPYILIAVIVLSGILPFADRAIYLDEPIFLKLARSVPNNWVFPSDIPSVFFGVPTSDFASHTHPPVGEYYLAVIDLLMQGTDELSLRLFFSIFPILAAIGFYKLARRHTRSPMAVTMLMIFSPAFFLMSHTIMMDMPMLAFLLLGIAFYLDHLDGHPKSLLIASLCFILAVGTGYTVLLPLGCLFLWGIYRKRPKTELVAIAAAPALLLVWLLAMTVHFGRFPLLDTVDFFINQPRSTLMNLLATFSFIGGVGLFPWTFLFLKPERRKFLIVLGVIAVTGAFLITLTLDWISLQQRVIFIILASSGITMIGGLRWAPENRKKELDLFFLLWVPAVLLFFILVGDMIQARYVLGALPALYLLLFRNTSTKKVCAILVPTLTLSVALAIADYRFVNAYRTWVEEVFQPLQKQGYRFWNGSESGLRFYLEQNNIQTLDYTNVAPNGGDLIVRQAGLFRYGLSPTLEPYLIPIRGWDLSDRFPLRTFNEEAGAGFHGSRFGLVPYIFSYATHDRVDIVQLSPLIANVPPGPEHPETLVRSDSRGVFLKQTQPKLSFESRIPEGAEVLYDREGEGRIEVEGNQIHLIKEGKEDTIWWNIRFFPSLPGSSF